MSRALIDEAAKALAAEGVRTRKLAAELSAADAARIAWADWTMKDVLGHLGASLGGLLRRMQGSVPTTAVGKTLEEINGLRRAERADWSLARVLEDVEQARAGLLAYLAGLDE